MAYGITCPNCNGTVDRNEYDYTKDMCKDCVFEEEMKESTPEKPIKKFFRNPYVLSGDEIEETKESVNKE